ncbi:MAG: hypothetical protein MUE78_01855 [Ilumatobacteraceae bacterium]|jgi:hypothetical protein|nr:hypothetical protein [Ilumatobacteraceae bacterium]
MTQYFCPACFAEVGSAAPVCLACGVTAADWEADRTYTQRLVHALGHPVPTTRMMAILALKGRLEPDTAMPLALCAQAYPVDVVQGMEILRAIEALAADAPQRQAALRNLTTHPSRLMRDRAAELLEQPPRTGDPGSP